MKFNWRSKKVIAATFAVILMALGVSNPGAISAAATSAVCSITECVE